MATLSCPSGALLSLRINASYRRRRPGRRSLGCYGRGGGLLYYMLGIAAPRRPARADTTVCPYTGYLRNL